jgi:putative Holliday junction resolvase
MPTDPVPPSLALPCPGRLLGIDYGTVRIGVAISDPQQTLSSPWVVYQRQTTPKMAKFFTDLILAERIVGLVVGLPIHNSGAPSEKSREATRFAAWLQQTTQCPTVLYDERFTTALARELLNQSSLSGKKRKERLDKIAAQVLLTSYLEAPDKAVRVSEPPRGEAPTQDLADSPRPPDSQSPPTGV